MAKKKCGKVLGKIKQGMEFHREISLGYRPKKKFVTNIDHKNKNNQNRFKCFIKRSKYTLISLGLINLDIRV